LEAFAKQFPGTVYAAQAQERLNGLRAAQVAAAQPAPKQPTPPAPAPSKQAAVVPPPAPQPARQQPPYSHWDCKSNDAWCRIGLEMRVLPTGSYLRGSSDAEIAALVKTYSNDWYKNEGPQRRVTISHIVAIAKHETTFELWDLCVAEKGCKTSPKDEGWGRGKRPAIDVSWDDITNEFLPWLNRKLGIAPTAPDRYRLPSEAEWEYAARAGTTGDYSFPSPITAAKANYDATSTHAGSPKGTYRQRTVPIDDGSFPLNPWGLAHVHGNAGEWVQDCYAENYGSAPIDGAPVESGSCSARVLRGGSWLILPQYLRSAYRNWLQPDNRNDYIGFRLARTLLP
jgi:formylglycine-generating enzyme required for sulfatase activity